MSSPPKYARQNNALSMRSGAFTSFLWFCFTFCLAVHVTGSSTVVRFGFSHTMFRDLNENDTKAALKLYATVLGSANDLVVSESPGIFANAASIADAFANGTADVAALTVQEYLAIPNNLISPRLLAASVADSYTEEYLLLVNLDSNITTLADLRGKHLIMYNSLRGWISPLWLDLALAKQGLEPLTRFFSRISYATKPSRTALPVFFHQEDACIVTRNGFNLMCELNPQLQKQLRVLASSPGYIPHVTCFRASISPELIDRMIKAAVAAQDTVSGKQILTIFQCDRIAEIAPEKLASVRELLADHTRLRAELSVATGKPDPLTIK